MARLQARSGPFMTAMPLAHRLSAKTLLKRGDWVSVRMEVSRYDPIMKDEWRVPVGDADCLFDGERFQVIESPQGDEAARHVQYHLDRLEKDEKRMLMINLVAC